MWNLKHSPYQVQLEALKMAKGRRGFAYFMEMGLGKTAVVYAEFLNLFMNDEVEMLVIFCPNSLKQVWEDEAHKWGVKLSITLWPKRLNPKNENAILVINYEALLGKRYEYLLNLLKEKRCYVALDESIHVKNPQAKRTRILIDLCKRATVVRSLSGAPIVKSALDIWGQLRVLGHLSGTNPFAFRNRFCVMGGYMGKQIVGTRNEAELSEILNKYSFRAKKSDWTDLPEQLYTNRHYQLSPIQSQLYNTMLADFVIQIKDTIVTAPMAITQSMKLQQISSGFIFDEESKIHYIGGEIPKLTILDEIINEIRGKVIIFCFYKPTINILMKKYPDAAVIRGGMKPDEIKEQKENFNTGSVNVLIAQLTAGKYGHTLLGDQINNPCNTNIFYENTYDLDARIQAEARNHRHGQRHVVTNIDLIGTKLDTVIIDSLRKKLNIGESIIQYLK